MKRSVRNIGRTVAYIMQGYNLAEDLLDLDEDTFDESRAELSTSSALEAIPSDDLEHPQPRLKILRAQGNTMANPTKYKNIQRLVPFDYFKNGSEWGIVFPNGGGTLTFDRKYHTIVASLDGFQWNVSVPENVCKVLNFIAGEDEIANSSIFGLKGNLTHMIGLLENPGFQNNLIGKCKAEPSGSLSTNQKSVSEMINVKINLGHCGYNILPL